MDDSALHQLGLNDSEIKVYFALLELESSTVGKIIEKSGVADSKIYFLLESLKKKGLVSFVIKNNVKHFQAASPENLVRLISDKEKQLSEQKKLLTEKIIPEIELKRKLTREKQEATVFEGFEGFRSALNQALDVMEQGEEYLVFLLGEELLQKNIVNFFNNYHLRRAEKKVKVRFIGKASLRNKLDQYKKYKLSKTRFTSQKYPVGTVIFKDRVMTMLFEDEPVVFLMKSKKMHDRYKEYFEEVWSSAKE
ncbi:MAG: TrmB family transcriptional regulator [Candidatus Nanoarchaeia archaeon]